MIFNSTHARWYHVEAQAPSHELGNKLEFTSAAEQGPPALSEGGEGGGGGGGLGDEDTNVVMKVMNIVTRHEFSKVLCLVTFV